MDLPGLSMYLVCACCHHVGQSKVKGKFRCSSCGSRAIRTARQVKTSMLNGGQMEPDAARVLTYAGLLSIAQQRGYKIGYAAAKFRDIFGIWPQGNPEPQNPSPEILWWIRMQARAWSKIKDAAAIQQRPKETPTSDAPNGFEGLSSELMTGEDWDTPL